MKTENIGYERLVQNVGNYKGVFHRARKVIRNMNKKFKAQNRKARVGIMNGPGSIIQEDFDKFLITSKGKRLHISGPALFGARKPKIQADEAYGKQIREVNRAIPEEVKPEKKEGFFKKLFTKKGR